MTTGALPALPTISGFVALLEEQPVVCGKAEGASPFGSAILRSEPRQRRIRVMDALHSFSEGGLVRSALSYGWQAIF